MSARSAKGEPVATPTRARTRILVRKDREHYSRARMDSRPIDPAAAAAGALPGGVRAWLPPLVLAIVAASTFCAGLTGAFVLDDERAITGNPVVQGEVPLTDAFTRTFWGQPLSADPPTFRPLTTLSFAIDRRLTSSALLFHISSLLWYVALVLAAWAFAQRCIGPPAAWFATAFFAVMPIHVENVTSLVGRADTQGALAALLALLALSPTIVSGKATPPLRLLLAALAFLAAMLCKESMVVLPIIVALLVEFRRRSYRSLPARKAHLPTLVMFAVLAIYTVVRLRLQPDVLSGKAVDDVLVGASVWERLGYGLELVARYGGLVVAPVHLCTGRKFAEVFRPEHLSFLMVGGAALLVLAGYLSWRAYRSRELPFVLAALASLFVVSGVVLAMPESMADRFMLLPSFFLCLALGPALLWLWRKGLIGRALMLVVLVVQIVLSNRQSRTWRDEGTLLSHAVVACPDSLHNHFRYAEYLADHGQSAEAVWHYAVVTKGRHAFPYAWSHPARQQELSLPIDERLRDMHNLLGFTIDEPIWRRRFEGYLISIGRAPEARLFASVRPER